MKKEEEKKERKMKNDSFSKGHKTKSCLIQLKPERRHPSAKLLFAFSSDKTEKKAFGHFVEKKVTHSCVFYRFNGCQKLILLMKTGNEKSANTDETVTKHFLT